MSFLDKTFCASPNCLNECGRQMTQAEKNELTFRVLREKEEHGDAAIIPVSYAYFCDPLVVSTDVHKFLKKYGAPE